jgi:hypothetical protein
MNKVEREKEQLGEDFGWDSARGEEPGPVKNPMQNRRFRQFPQNLEPQEC